MLRALPPKTLLRSNTETANPRSINSCAALRPPTPPPRIATLQDIITSQSHRGSVDRWNLDKLSLDHILDGCHRHNGAASPLLHEGDPEQTSFAWTSILQNISAVNRSRARVVVQFRFQ